MMEFINTISNTILALINFITSIINSVILLLNYAMTSVLNLMNIADVLPSSIVPFFTLFLVISILFFFLNRRVN